MNLIFHFLNDKIYYNALKIILQHNFLKLLLLHLKNILESLSFLRLLWKTVLIVKRYNFQNKSDLKFPEV